MKIRLLLIAAAGLAILSATSLEAKKLTISKEALQDKIRGAWAGQVIGCTYGGPTEFKFSSFIPDEYPIEWHDHIVKWWYDHVPGLYDDVYMDLTFVEVFEREGLDAPVESFANAVAHAGYPLWHAKLCERAEARVEPS